MRVTWNSKFADDFPQVKYIIDSQAYVISATSYTYTTDDLCGYPAKSQGWRDPGYFHTAIIKVCLASRLVYGLPSRSVSLRDSSLAKTRSLIAMETTNTATLLLR
jgi:hypothetical protein